MNGNEVSLVRAIRGPITLITVGVLFALNNFTVYRFHETWPVLLIVFGLLSLLRRGTENVQPAAPRPFPPSTGPYTYPPPETGYRQSTYTAPPTPDPAAPAKGGFGASAPPRSDPGQTPPSGDAI